MRILRSIVAPSAAFMAFCDSKITGCGSIRAQVIRDELVWDKAIFLQKFAHQFERRPLFASGLDENVENFTSASTARQRYAKTYRCVTALFPKVHGYISPRLFLTNCQREFPPGV